MSTEQGGTPAVSTVDETQSQPTEPVKQETAPEATADAVKEAEVKEKDPELKRLERELRKAQRINSRLHQETESLRSQTGKPEEPKAEQPSVDPFEMAKHIARVERYTDTANKLVEEGTKKYGGKYIDSLKELSKEVGDFVNKDGTPTPFMEAVLEVADKPTDLLKYLGDNPEIAEELAGLSPYRLAKKLDRIEREMADAPKSKISNAPKPIDPVKGQASNSGLSDDLPTDEWMKRREAELKARRVRL